MELPHSSPPPLLPLDLDADPPDHAQASPSSAGEGPPRRPRKQGGAKVCGVCGDLAKNSHFGGVSCDSCKAFFRRSVQRNNYSKFKCKLQQDCVIVKGAKRLCQFCRFQKCQHIGMDIKSVMSDNDRIALWRRKLAKHRKNNQSTDISQDTGSVKPSLRNSKDLLSEESQVISHLVTLQELVFSSMPYPENCMNQSTEDLANLFFYICQKLRCLFYRLDDFFDIPKDDQLYILRNGIATSIYIHGAYNYDSVTESWPADDINEALRLPCVTKETLRNFTIYPELYDALMTFYNKYGRDIKDEAVVVLMCLIALFHDESGNLIARKYVNKMYHKYVGLLRSYLISKRGDAEGRELLDKLLHSLFDIKRFVSYHNKVDIKAPSIQSNTELLSNIMHFQTQMHTLTDLLNCKWNKTLPEHSSAFNPNERLSLDLGDQNSDENTPNLPCLEDSNPLENPHHHVTNAIFGSCVRTDKLLSLSDIFKLSPTLPSNNERKEIESYNSQISWTEPQQQEEYCQYNFEGVGGQRYDTLNPDEGFHNYDRANESHHQNASNSPRQDLGVMPELIFRPTRDDSSSMLNYDLMRDCLVTSTEYEN